MGLSTQIRAEKGQMCQSAEKVLATNIWNYRGQIIEDDLKKHQAYFAKKKVLSHQDSARMHTCIVAIAKFNKKL